MGVRELGVFGGNEGLLRHTFSSVCSIGKVVGTDFEAGSMFLGRRSGIVVFEGSLGRHCSPAVLGFVWRFGGFVTMMGQDLRGAQKIRLGAIL